MKFRITAQRKIYSSQLNDWWTEHLERYLTKRGFEFTKWSPMNALMDIHPMFDVQARNAGEAFDLRLIAQRYGQERIGVYMEEGFRWEPLF